MKNQWHLKNCHVRRTLGITLLCVFMISGAAMASAEFRFNDGFLGITWGTHKDQLPDLGLKPSALNNIYKTGYSSAFLMEGAGKSAMEMDTVPLLSIFLNFFDQRLYGADLVFNPEQREKIYDILVNEMGTACDKTIRGDHWQTAKVAIVLTERELIIVAEAFDPEKSNEALVPEETDAPCCQDRG